MSDPIAKVEDKLDKAGRSCLRLIKTGSLTLEQSQTLSTWMYGCMNQRFTIRGRVEKRGSGELTKVLLYLSKVWEVVEQITKESNKLKE